MTNKEFKDGVNELVMAGKNVVIARLEMLTCYTGGTPEGEVSRQEYVEQAQDALNIIALQEEERPSMTLVFFYGLSLGFLFATMLVSIAMRIATGTW